MATPRLTRRRLLAATSTGALAGLAGCAGVLGEDDAEMTLMIERARTGGDDGVSAGELAHTCSHLAELEPFSLTAGGSREDAASANAHEPYTVTLSGDTGYVSFEPRESADFGFFVADGDVTVGTGTAVYEETDVADCDEIDRYTVIEPENGEIVVELAAAD